MRKTNLTLPRRFLTDIGFVAACQQPLSAGLVRVLPEMCSLLNANRSTTLEDLNRRLESYEPPRWAGYYIDRREQCGRVHDGLFHVPIPLSFAFTRPLLGELRRLHFSHSHEPLPIVGGLSPAMKEPALILLHDTQEETTYLEPFESGVMLLQRLRRTSL